MLGSMLGRCAREKASAKQVAGEVPFATFLLIRWRSLMPGHDPTIPGSSENVHTDDA